MLKGLGNPLPNFPGPWQIHPVHVHLPFGPHKDGIPLANARHLNGLHNAPLDGIDQQQFGIGVFKGQPLLEVRPETEFSIATRDSQILGCNL